jgi:UDP-N-acetylglucosamine 2-epimerase (non-hydrolysing)
MPEELNRILTDRVSDLLLAHSASAVENLAKEGIAGGTVQLVGNTMIDSLRRVEKEAQERAASRDFGLEPGRYVLATLHRPKLVDDAELLGRTIVALGDLARAYPVVLPAHPRTERRLRAAGILIPRDVQIVAPVPYIEFVSLQGDAAAVVTDSGGVQEEATALGVRCFTLRETTERPITITHGTNELLGLDPNAISRIPELLRHSHEQSDPPPLWDGHAGPRAAEAIETFLSGGR